MPLLIYHCTWTVVVILLLPFLPLMRKGRILERLGWRLPSRLFSDKTAWVHALSLGEVLSSLPLIEALKEKFDFARKAMGLNPSPFDAWLAARGLKTLAVRMERHAANAKALAEGEPGSEGAAGGESEAVSETEAGS